MHRNGDGRSAAGRGELMRLMDGYIVTQLLRVAVRLGVADVLAERPCSAAEVADAVGVDGARMARILRGLAVEGVLDERPDGDFALTEVGGWLRTDLPGSVGGQAVARAELYYAAAGGLLEAVRDGGTAFERLHGEPFFAHLARDAARETAFQGSMRSRAVEEANAVVAVYDLGGLRRIVDVGGGDGTLLVPLLRAAPELRAVLVDRPPVIERARATLAAAGVGERCDCVPGDFFAAVPPGGDAYLLSRVLHDWEDVDARRILDACRAAMAPGALLLVVEAILPERARDLPEAIRMDLLMLVLVGARERTEPEYADLLAASGFALRRVVPTQSATGVAVLEATAL
jgi:predicted O-methyltransferase YrrM